MSRERSEDVNPDAIELYKFYANTTNEVSNRRLKTNRFFVSLLSGIFVATPVVFDLDNLTPIRFAAMGLLGFVGLSLCVLWFFNILSYKQLNSGKYEVIHAMEQDLPYACYDREWEELQEGTDVWTYIPHWKVERLVPFVLAVPYLVILAFALVGLT